MEILPFLGNKAHGVKPPLSVQWGYNRNVCGRSVSSFNRKSIFPSLKKICFSDNPERRADMASAQLFAQPLQSTRRFSVMVSKVLVFGASFVQKPIARRASAREHYYKVNSIQYFYFGRACLYFEEKHTLFS